MSTDRETVSIVRAWLDDGVTKLPDRILDVVLDQVPATPQRRSWWPARRDSAMQRMTQVALAAAALLIVGFVGFQLLPKGNVGAVATPPPTPTTAPVTDAPTAPSSTTRQLPETDQGPLAPGSYEIGAPFPVRITVTVPAGWHGQVFQYFAGLWANSAADDGLFFQLPGQLRVDPCDPAKGSTDILGLTVDQLVAAIRTVPGVAVSNVASTSIGGAGGTTLVITAPKDLSSCKLTQAGYSIWTNPLGGASPILSQGESIQFWLLDVAGTIVAVGIQDSHWTATQQAEAQAVFQSIRIAPAS
jgi:hypothetical protein